MQAYYFYAAGFAGHCFSFIMTDSTSGRLFSTLRRRTFATKPIRRDSLDRSSRLGQKSKLALRPGRHLRPREKGKLQSCVSDLAEVVAGHGPLHHVLSIHLEDVIAAVRDERSVRQRHTLVAEGNDRVSLEGGSTHQSTSVSIPHYLI